MYQNNNQNMNISDSNMNNTSNVNNTNNMNNANNMNNTSNPENQSNPPGKKANGLLLFIIIILLCSICGVLGYKFNDFMDSQNNNQNEVNNTNNDNQNPDNQTTENKNEEVEITDNTLINSLKAKSNMLYITGNYTFPMSDDTQFFASATSGKTFTNQEKLLTIILYNDYFTDNIKKESIPESTFTKYFPTYEYEPDNIDDEYQIDATAINNIYKDIYGVEAPNQNINISGCPSIVYDSPNNKYLIISRCGGIKTDKLLTYNYKYTKDDNNAYVYVSAGYRKDYLDENYAETIYSDVAATKVYKQNKESQDYQISSSDYNDFEKYKLTFKYENNNYSFSKLEKIT